MFNEDREGNDSFYDELYLWVRPSEDNLHFIKEQTVNAGCCQLVSIGCGSGLLEWLIHTATGLEVTGIEVDRSWWESSCAPPVFLPLMYADEEHGSDITTNKNAALLFCYFNNGSAFSEYIRQYEGNCFIVIGPGEGRGTHTHPAPFNVILESESAWKMEAFQEVQHTKDFIAVYVKSQSLK